MEPSRHARGGLGVGVNQHAGGDIGGPSAELSGRAGLATAAPLADDLWMPQAHAVGGQLLAEVILQPVRDLGGLGGRRLVFDGLRVECELQM